jgi:hypothetical protein
VQPRAGRSSGVAPMMISRHEIEEQFSPRGCASRTGEADTVDTQAHLPHCVFEPVQ